MDSQDLNADLTAPLEQSIAIVRERDALRARVASLEAALDECEEYFDDRSDVIDGAYGEPAPNKEMSMLMVVRAALKVPHG